MDFEDIEGRDDLLMGLRCPHCGGKRVRVPAKGRKSGFRLRCRACDAAKQKVYYEKNREAVIARSMAWEREHLPHVRERQKAYREANLPKFAEIKRRYREKKKQPSPNPPDAP